MDRYETGATSEPANRPSPGGNHVGQPATVNNVGLGLLGYHALGPGEASSACESLAKKAVTWLGARGTLAARPERVNPSVSAEIEGSGPSTAGPVITDRDLTPEDFWSLLRDACYEVW